MAAPPTDSAQALRAISTEIAVCTQCRLAETRNHTVPGEGAPDADVMFIGEGPGFQEDRQGRPFVGPAGKFLDELLGTIGWSREHVFITNTVKCRPPENRDPRDDELDTCEALYLRRQLEVVNPTLLVTLGRFSLMRLFPSQSISRAHGQLLYKDDLAVYPLYHPAAALHQQRLRDVIIEDFRNIPAALETARSRHSTSQAGTPASDNKQPGVSDATTGQQLSFL